jgi:uncharacterized protein YajQ (UPF0234 family)
LQVPKGRRELLRDLRHKTAANDQSSDLTAESDRPDASDAKHRKQRDAFRTALRVLQRLSNALSGLDRPRNLPQWIGALQDLADELGMFRFSSPSAKVASHGVQNSDRVAWDRLKEVLSAQYQLERWLELEPETLTLTDFILRLQDALRCETLPPKHDDVGRVRVLAAHTARGLQIPYLLVAGLAEQSFPPPTREDRIYSDVELRQLHSAGLHFTSSRERGCEEMLLFYETITRATRRIVLSYPGLDGKAQPLLPSPYLTELERCCGPTEITRTRDNSLSPVPSSGRAHCPREERLKAVTQVLEEKMVKRKVSLKVLDYGKLEEATKGRARQVVTLQSGINQEKAKAIGKFIKELQLKGVQHQVQGEQLRVTGKKRDDLQTAIAKLKEHDFGVPLQFTNFRD